MQTQSAKISSLFSNNNSLISFYFSIILYLIQPHGQPAIPLLLSLVMYHLGDGLFAAHNRHALFCPGNGRVKNIAVKEHPRSG